MNINRHTLLQWLSLLACGIWIGILAFLGVVVAPSIFKFMDSKTQAGLLNGIILYKMNIMEMVCSVVLLGASAFSFFLRRNRLSLTRILCSALLLVNLGYYSLVITPDMNELKRTIQSFETPGSEDPRPERKEFDLLHKQYSSLVAANTVLLLFLSFLITHSVKQDEA